MEEEHGKDKEIDFWTFVWNLQMHESFIMFGSVPIRNGQASAPIKPI